MSDTEREELMGRLRSLEAEVSRLHGTPPAHDYAAPAGARTGMGTRRGATPSNAEATVRVIPQTNHPVSHAGGGRATSSNFRALSNRKFVALSVGNPQCPYGIASQGWGHDGARRLPTWTPRR